MFLFVLLHIIKRVLHFKVNMKIHLTYLLLSLSYLSLVCMDKPLKEVSSKDYCELRYLLRKNYWNNVNDLLRRVEFPSDELGDYLNSAISESEITPETAVILLHNGANVNKDYAIGTCEDDLRTAPEDYGPPLCLAIKDGCSQEMIDTLLAYGADTKQAALTTKKTPLQLAHELAAEDEKDVQAKKVVEALEKKRSHSLAFSTAQRSLDRCEPIKKFLSEREKNGKARSCLLDPRLDVYKNLICGPIKQLKDAVISGRTHELEVLINKFNAEGSLTQLDLKETLQAAVDLQDIYAVDVVMKYNSSILSLLTMSSIRYDSPKVFHHCLQKKYFSERELKEEMRDIESWLAEHPQAHDNERCIQHLEILRKALTDLSK